MVYKFDFCIIYDFVSSQITWKEPTNMPQLVVCLLGKLWIIKLNNQLNNFVITLSESKIEGLWECWLFDLPKAQSAIINWWYPKKK